MKRLILLMILAVVATVGMATDRTGLIRTGFTSLSAPMVMGTADTIDASQTVLFTINNNQKYMQFQTFTVTLDNKTGTSDVVCTGFGKVNSGDTYVQIGSPVTLSADGTATITATEPHNYNYLKLQLVAGAGVQHAHITAFTVKTANAYDIPANSGTLTVSRATSGTVTITSKDNNADAALTVAAGGSGALTLGDAGSTTVITSSDWAIDATGVATGLGAITSNGLVSAATLTVTGLTTLTGGAVLPSNSTVHWAKGGAVTAVATGTDKACSNGARWWVELEIPYNITITGLAYLVGSVGGTDSVVVQLVNSTGVEVASSRLPTGNTNRPAVIVGTAAQFQAVPFTTPYAAVAGKYYAVVQFNGTTAKFRTYLIPGSKFIAGTAAGTWGTKANITPGTTFTADTGPVVMTY